MHLILPQHKEIHDTPRKKSRREKVSKKYKGRRHPKITMGEGIQKV
jgi:hypothetical protein